jgi:hypothetical protein
MHDESCIYSYPVLASNPAKPHSPFGIQVPASAIVADAAGHGELQVLVTAEGENASAEKLSISLQGAELSDAAPSSGVTRAANGKLKVKQGAATLQLTNLVPNSVVKISLEDGTTDAGSATLGVVAGAAGGKDKP